MEKRQKSKHIWLAQIDLVFFMPINSGYMQGTRWRTKIYSTYLVNQLCKLVIWAEQKYLRICLGLSY